MNDDIWHKLKELVYRTSDFNIAVQSICESHKAGDDISVIETLSNEIEKCLDELSETLDEAEKK